MGSEMCIRDRHHTALDVALVVSIGVARRLVGYLRLEVGLAVGAVGLLEEMVGGGFYHFYFEGTR